MLADKAIAPRVKARSSRLFPPRANSSVTSVQLQKALANHKVEGLFLAYRARMLALGAVAIFLLFIVPWPNVLWLEMFIAAFMAVGWLQQRYGRVGRSRIELLLVVCDIVLMTLVVIVPNPFNPSAIPLPVQYRFNPFTYLFIILAGATISLHWRTIMTVAAGAPLVWLIGVAWVWWTFQPTPEFSLLAAKFFGERATLTPMFDPNALNWDMRIQEAVVFAIVAAILALNSGRSERLLAQFAETERERTNLSRYFSPNVIEELSQSDEPLGRTRKATVAVLFADIVGFTRFAASVTPAEAMTTLQVFFARMERCVFAHNGTLDKYLGDGLMATFGTPTPGKTNGLDAVRCARSMLVAVDDWNAERARAGLPAIRIGIGAHYGEVVLGNIGVDRLEFAVIGDSVNIASRLESLTRELDCAIVISQALFERAGSEGGNGETALAGFASRGQHPIAGTTNSIAVATFTHT